MKELDIGNHELTSELTVRSVEVFELGIELDEIPAPGLCGYCGAPQQKEYLEFEVEGAGVDVMVERPPGYGCTDCGLKAFPRDVTYRLLTSAAERFQLHGEVELAARLAAAADNLIGTDARVENIE
jgi:hypothetical protein